jgi:benzoate membrane transport protein
MLRELSPSTFAAGLLTTFVGFASTFAVVINGLRAVGATPAQAASGLMAVTMMAGAGSLWLSLRTKMPTAIAWSTPGAALLAASGAVEGGFPAAVGAFLVCGVLLTLAGVWRPLGRWVEHIPPSLANAMLAGVLLNLCLAPVKAVAQAPLAGMLIVGAWVLVGRLNRLLAVPAAVVVAAVVIGMTVPLPPASTPGLWPDPILVRPVFSLAAMISIAVPLFIVTMASQNIPGMAVLAINGYRPSGSRMFRATGLMSVMAAPFGGHAVNLAAITAAICAGPDSHPDPKRRYWAAAIAGIGYLLIGLLAGAATVFIGAAPPILIEAVAGLALLGAFGSALAGATSDPAEREPAMIAFVVAASGLTFYGIGSAFWGLVAGYGLRLISRVGKLRP